VPRYLGERDHPWLCALLDEYARAEGEKRSDLAARLREPLTSPAPRSKLRVAIHLLESLETRVTSAVPPADARWHVFRAAASMTSAPRTDVLAHVASELDVPVVALEAALVADLGSERRVPSLPATLSPASLALAANRALASSLLRRSASVRLTASGDPRRLLVQARRLGLICAVEQPALRRASGDDRGNAPSRVALDITGPLALTRHADAYGKALVSLLACVATCDGFELTAWCTLTRGRPWFRFVIRPGDPLAVDEFRAPLPSEPADPLARAKHRFAADFETAASNWTVIREPSAADAVGVLELSDLELVHRGDATRRWRLDLCGFWTAEHVAQELARRDAANLRHSIVYLDDRRRCNDAPVPDDPRILRYKSKPDPVAVLALIGE
jgi:predicted nuclease of restriction endonuclease-like RecB superfamily